MTTKNAQKPRILPLPEPYKEEIGALLESMMPPGIPPLRLFRTLARNPRILKKIRASNLLDRGSIGRREREIVILRTTARCGSEYEWGVHVTAFASHFGIEEDTIIATVKAEWDDPVWSQEERPLVRLVDELQECAEISDELWKRLRETKSEEQIVELIALAGFYRTISYLTNGLKIELEDGAARFPTS